MSLNIKDEEAHRLAKQLARLTHESVTTAVREAVRERLQRVRSEKGGGKVERLLQIGRECAEHLPKSVRSLDHADFLYDEKGLPK